MKKLFALLLALMMALSLAACGGKDNPKPSGSSGAGDTPPASTQQEPDTPDPGASQDGYKSGTSQKADGGQMESDEKLNEDMPAIPLSELTSIGKPVGYTVKGTKAIGDLTGIKFAPDSGSIADGDVEQYAAAIWNLCIDQVDNGALGDREVGEEDGEVYASMSDAKKSDEKFSWYYNINGKRLQATVWIEDDMIMLGFSDWSDFIG